MVAVAFVVQAVEPLLALDVEQLILANAPRDVTAGLTPLSPAITVSASGKGS